MAPTSARPQRAQQARARDTRLLILDAAVQCLNEHGYAGTTTTLIQQRAGVSRGRLLHHFPSRMELLAAASRHLVGVRAVDFAEHLGGYLGDRLSGRRRVERAVELTWSTFHHPYFWAAMELWLAARSDTELREVLAPHERKLGATIQESMDRFFGSEFTGHPRYATLCDILFTSMRGVKLSYAVVPRNPATDRHIPQWKELAVTMLEA